jgi:hypothetical protein
MAKSSNCNSISIFALAPINAAIKGLVSTEKTFLVLFRALPLKVQLRAPKNRVLASIRPMMSLTPTRFVGTTSILVEIFAVHDDVGIRAK